MLNKLSQMVVLLEGKDELFASKVLQVTYLSFIHRLFPSVLQTVQVLVLKSKDLTACHLPVIVRYTI
jgi:hypothetical protein